MSCGELRSDRGDLAADDQKWEQWLDLCDDSFHYAIKSFSPEIIATCVFPGQHRKDLATMVKLLPSTIRPLATSAAYYGLYVDVADDGKTASAVSSFVVYQNLLDGVNSHIDAGESRLFWSAVTSTRVPSTCSRTDQVASIDRARVASHSKIAGLQITVAQHLAVDLSDGSIVRDAIFLRTQWPQ